MPFELIEGIGTAAADLVEGDVGERVVVVEGSGFEWTEVGIVEGESALVGLHFEGGLLADPGNGAALGDDGEEAREFFKDGHFSHRAVVGIRAGFEEVGDGFGIDVAGIDIIDAEATVDGGGALPEDWLGGGPAGVGELAVIAAGDESGEGGIVGPLFLGGIAVEVGIIFAFALIGNVAESAALDRTGEDGEHGLEGGLGVASTIEKVVEGGLGHGEGAFLIEEDPGDRSCGADANGFPKNLQPASDG